MKAQEKILKRMTMTVQEGNRKMQKHNDPLEFFVSKFTASPLQGVVKIGKYYFQLSSDLEALKEKISGDFNRDPVYAGIFLGEAKGKDLVPSISLIDILARSTDRKVMIDKRSAWLFICGRDVFGKSVISATVDRGAAIVFDTQGEVLGYGYIKGSKAQQDTVFLKNSLDRGDFLRREMSRKK